MDTRWIENLMLGHGSKHSNLREHILSIHKNNPGFTENCAQNFKNNAGRSSYQWLAELIQPKIHYSVLDLACGSGALLEICDELYGQRISLTGVDMSEDELALATNRLRNKKIKLKNSTAQNLSVFSKKSYDVILCHWALTLMDPLEPVLREVKRILKPKGIFGAIIDGDHNLSTEYEIVHNIIYGWAQKQFANYGSIELGDPRARDPIKLVDIAKKIFQNSAITIEPDILLLKAKPLQLAKDVSGFFYAALVLSEENNKKMIKDLQKFFELNKDKNQISTFHMPINRLIIELKNQPTN